MTPVSSQGNDPVTLPVVQPRGFQYDHPRVVRLGEERSDGGQKKDGDLNVSRHIDGHNGGYPFGSANHVSGKHPSRRIASHGFGAVKSANWRLGESDPGSGPTSCLRVNRSESVR